MCDTFVVMSDTTHDGSVIFGKNSDREPNEAHEVVVLPAATHPEGSLVQCTYLKIPQVRHTYAVLLAKPFWIWGAEMGANEHGVVIGNEAVFSKFPAQKEPALIGMDFIRLALERSKTAEEALNTITSLLESYGQGGNCGLIHPTYYHNSFLIADFKEAWVLETVDKQWAAERVRSGVRSISNAITIENRWDLCSKDLVATAIDRGWCKDRRDFSFSKCYSDFLYTRFSDSRRRQQCTTGLLLKMAKNVGVSSAMQVLRAHGMAESAAWRPDRAITGADVCCHAGFGPVRISQTTGSMVSHLKDGEEPVHWVTATAAPCTSLFKPAWVSTGKLPTGPAPTAEFDSKSLWWRHEQLHRTVVMNYPSLISLYKAERDQLEADFLRSAASENPMALIPRCFDQADQAETAWLERVKSSGIRPAVRFYYRMAWQNFNRQAKITP